MYRMFGNYLLYLDISKYMVTSSGLSTIFTKGNNFCDILLAFQGDESRKEVNSYRKEFSPRGANSFLKELTCTEKGGKNENGKSCFP